MQYVLLPTVLAGHTNRTPAVANDIVLVYHPGKCQNITSIGPRPLSFKSFQFFFNSNSGGGGVQLGPFGTAAITRSIVIALGDYDDGEIGGMMIGKGNRSTRRKPAPVPLCPPQTPHACPDANPVHRGGKPATNRLSYGTAKSCPIPFIIRIRKLLERRIL
jgi:hypothetical protein